MQFLEQQLLYFRKEDSFLRLLFQYSRSKGILFNHFSYSIKDKLYSTNTKIILFNCIFDGNSSSIEIDFGSPSWILSPIFYGRSIYTERFS